MLYKKSVSLTVVQHHSDIKIKNLYLKRLDLPFLCIFDPGLLFKIFSTLAPF